jgi:hypothetical protein
LGGVTTSSESTDQPLIADGGITVPIPPLVDPYKALDELMVVVEALCPVWPQRETFEGHGPMLL